MVIGGEYARRTYRSPRPRTAGASSRTRTNARLPGAIAGTPLPASVGPTIGHAPERLGRPLMKPHARAVLQRFRRSAADRRSRRRGAVVLNAPGVASVCPRDRTRDVDARRDVDGRSLSSDRFGSQLPVHVHAANADPRVSRQQRERVVHGDAPGHERARHDGPEALHRERAIDGQARHAGLRTGWKPAGRLRERGAKRGEPFPAARGYRHDRRPFEKRAGDELRHVVARGRAPSFQRRRGRTSSAQRLRSARAAAGRCRNAPASAASLIRRPRRRGRRDRCRRRRPACS